MESAIFHSVEIDQCVQCTGLWLDHREIDELFAVSKLPERLMAEPPVLDSLLSVPEGGRTCPRCNEFLTVVEVDQIRIDICSDCKGFFLDPGEFRQLAEVAEKRFQEENP